MASSLTTSKGCLNQPTATFLHKCDQKYSASAQRVLVAVGAGEWQSLENGSRCRMVVAGEWQALENGRRWRMLIKKWWPADPYTLCLPSTLTNINNLVGVLRDQGNYEEAEEMYLHCDYYGHHSTHSPVANGPRRRQFLV
jgi:hypothetical protein